MDPPAVNLLYIIGNGMQFCIHECKHAMYDPRASMTVAIKWLIACLMPRCLVSILPTIIVDHSVLLCMLLAIRNSQWL